LKELLSPRLSDLQDECVLVQAWKKTAAYLRQHNWYADTLELDYQSLRLPDFLGELKERLQTPESWVSTPLEMVPAPKSQTWELKQDVWKPKKSISKKIRPLAHVALPDQVLATAMLLCLGDLVETAMGDPLVSVERPENRRKVIFSTIVGEAPNFIGFISGITRISCGVLNMWRVYMRLRRRLKAERSSSCKVTWRSFTTEFAPPCFTRRCYE